MGEKFTDEEWDFWDTVIEKCDFPKGGVAVFKEDYSVLRWYFEDLFSNRPNILHAVQIHKNCLDGGFDYAEALTGSLNSHFHGFLDLVATEGEEVADAVKKAVKHFKEHPSEGVYAKADIAWEKYLRQLAAVCREHPKQAEQD